jgi:RecQ-mediated genome instability protein 1
MTLLPRKYALQFEQIRDVSQSAYTQLQEMRKQIKENAVVVTTTPQACEFCPTRMPQLASCGRIQNIQRMQYWPVRSLDEEQLLPGCKVLVVDPVECRRILQLEQHNLETLGGEVDSLLISNASENVLARLLNFPLNPDP